MTDDSKDQAPPLKIIRVVYKRPGKTCYYDNGQWIKCLDQGFWLMPGQPVAIVKEEN